MEPKILTIEQEIEKFLNNVRQMRIFNKIKNGPSIYIDICFVQESHLSKNTRISFKNYIFFGIILPLELEYLLKKNN